MIDGRLLVPAVTAWPAAVITTVVLSTELDLTARHSRAVAILVGAGVWAVLLGAAALLALARRAARRRGDGWRSAAIGVAGLVLGVASAAAHVAMLTPPPVTSWIQARATADVTAVLVAEPMNRTSAQAPLWAARSRHEVRIATSEVAARGEVVEVSLPMILRLPADASVPSPGTMVRIVGRLSPPRSAEDAATLTSDGSPTHVVVLAPPGAVDRVAHAMRLGLREALRGVPADAASLVAGLAVGDVAAQPPDLRQDMRTSGLSHLTAVSGGNVAVVIVSVLAIAGLVRVSLAARVVIALAALAFFVVLVGPQPSVVRAAVMGGLVVLGMLAGGRRAGPAVLCTAVIVLVVIAPGLTASWGFALSAGATAGLILLSPRVADRLARWPVTARWPPALREALAVTTAAQLATMPLLIAMGVTVGWVALLANLLAMPVVPVITVLGLLAAAVSPVLPVAAMALAHLAAPLASWIASVARACAGLPGAVVPWPSGWWGVVALVVAAGAAYCLRRVVARAYPGGVPAVLRRSTAVIVAGLTVLWVVLPPSRRDWPPPGWVLIMCDVGQGDALILKAAEGSAVVVDAGPDPEAVDTCLSDAGIVTVPAVVLTHFHADHVGGLSGVLRDRDVSSVLVSAIRDPPGEALLVDRLLDDEGLTATTISAGDAREVGQVTWRAIWPRRVIRSGSVPNNASAVLLVHIGTVSAALLGDVEPEAQVALSPDLMGQHFDVVKVPHHGSRYVDPRLTTWAPASIALVSVGAGNDYGHPAASTLAAWRAIGALVARTDEVGDVAVVEQPGAGVALVVRHGMLPSS